MEDLNQSDRITALEADVRILQGAISALISCLPNSRPVHTAIGEAVRTINVAARSDPAQADLMRAALARFDPMKVRPTDAINRT